MRKSDHIHRLDFNDEFLLDSAEKRLQSGDYLGALTILNKRSTMHDPSADASALYADVYEAMELWPLAADAWFRFLDTCNEADFAEGYEGLAIVFMNMGNELQSALYYHRALTAERNREEGEESFEPEEELEFDTVEPSNPPLRLVHSEDDDPELIRQGLELLKDGEIEEARNSLLEVSQKSADYPSAAGLAAMCSLMLGDEEGAERECEWLLERYPENIQALTTYCAVLGARGRTESAQEAAKKLASLPVKGVDDLYRVATALCETGLDEEAFEKLTQLKKKLPYDENVLYFHAVAGYHTERLKEAIASLETLTTVYPRKAVASYYLVKMRELEDGVGERFPMNYYYRMPEEEYSKIADYFLAATHADEDSVHERVGRRVLREYLRLAFDEMDGRDEKLQMLAIKVAVAYREDAFLREILLDYNGNELIKLAALHDLTLRNEDNSFGTVVCNLYKEFYTRRIEIGPRKHGAFLRAFADVYAKFALLGEKNEGKICAAAEDIYDSIKETGAWEYIDERQALAAAIYREARIPNGERTVEEVARLFDAPVATVKKILDFMM